MKMRSNTLTLTLFMLFVVLVACVPQTPIPIYVTPTPQTLASSEALADVDISAETPAVETTESFPVIDVTKVPTLNASELVKTSTPTPTVTMTPVASDTTVPSQSGQTVTPAVVVQGPIVDADYVVSPTTTPRPTETPTLTPSPEPGTPLPQLDSSQMGLQLYYNMPVPGWSQTLSLAQQTNVGWVKLQANWKFLQPDSPDQFDQSFRLFQLHVQAADKAGFKVLLSIAKAPDWARSNRENAGPPDDPQLLVNFINFLLEKVGSNTDAIEVWNEPNILREWTVNNLPFTGAGYMQLFAPAYNAIRAYSPSMAIVTAGLAPTSGAGAVDDRLFLEQMYDAGLANYQDIAVGIHPYSWGNPPDHRCCNTVPEWGWDDNPHFFFSHNVEDYREIMVRRGHGNVQMWVTEFGWPTWEGFPVEPPEPWMSYVSPQQQADYTLRAFEIGQSLDYIGPMFLWNLNFANEIIIESRNEIAGYSLLYPGFDSGRSIQERPLYWMLNQRP